MESIHQQFQKEAEALVNLIGEMINAGQHSEASQLLEQYKLLNPGDPRIKDLQMRIGNDSFASAGDNIPDFLKNTESIFVVAWMAKKRSGFFTSIFNKIRLLEEKLGYNSTILVTGHDVELRKNEVWLKTFTGNSEIMSAKTKILNVYEYYQKSYAEGLENKAIYSRKASKNYKKLTDNIFGEYKNDELVREDIYTGYSGSLRTERFYKDGKIYEEVYYDDWGYLNYVREYDAKDEKKYTAKYYTTDGELRLIAHYDLEIDDMQPQKLFACDKDGNITREYNGNAELAGEYFEKTLKDDKKYLLVFETGTVGKIADFLDSRLKNISKISIIHSIFLKNAYNPKSGPQSYYEYVCNNPTKMDGIVLLTHAARRDFNKLYGCHKSTYVIPHPYSFDIEKVDFDTRDKKKAVVISRLFPEKQIDVTIEIFCEVIKVLPDVCLEIYGIGPEQDEIAALIERLGVGENIRLMGYTDDPISIYRQAAMFIMTSAAEGFGLTLMESICNGCPAFSFDIKYGPSDIIQEGKTGFLFPFTDRRKFAAAIIEYFKSPDMQRKMSENCYNDAVRFSRDAFLQNWLNMVEMVIEN